jgi:hypothetical protein
MRRAGRPTLRGKHGISGSGTASSGQGTLLVQSTLGKVGFPDGVLRKFENAIVDYVVGGGISLLAAGGQLQEAGGVADEPPSTRTILTRIVELFHIAENLLSSILRQLDVAISLDGRLVQPKSEGLLRRDGKFGRSLLYKDEEFAAHHH